MKKKFVYIKSLLALAAVAGLTLVFTGCKEEKKETTVIITQKPEPPKPKAIEKTGDYSQTIEFGWVGSSYNVAVERKADETLPVIDDGTGNKYYDNNVNVRIIRKDGSVFFSRTFTKNDFAKYVDNAYLKKSALLGVVFDKAEGDYVFFAASVGSPDNLSDEYIPFELKVSRMGDVSISRSTNLEEDFSVPDKQDDDEGV